MRQAYSEHRDNNSGTGVLRDRSGEYSGHSDLSDLLNARQEWHAVLDDVLEGTHEDLEAIMSSARSAATVKTE